MPFHTGGMFLPIPVCGKQIYSGWNKSLGDNFCKMWFLCCQIPQCEFHTKGHVFLVFCKPRIFTGMGYHSIVLYW